jgi:hypothetical protein
MSKHSPSIALQPASPKKDPDRTNLKNTIETRVDLRDHADIIAEEDLAALELLFPDGMVPMWGIRRDKRNVVTERFEELKPGDVVIFAGDSRIHLWGTVAYTWVNADLARRLWGPEDRRQPTWELMYAIMNPIGKNVPMSDFRSWAGWDNPNRHVRPFQFLDEDRIPVMIEHLGIEAPEIPDLKRAGRRTTGASSFEGALDRSISSYARAEQSKLRQLLIPGATGICALCGRELPAEFLVAAHIKKRALCSDEEKADLVNIAMRNCKFGCDDLFEHGYIAVSPDARIDVSYRVADIPVVAAYVSDHFSNRTVDQWSRANEKYFAWHRSNVFRQDLRPQA